MMMALCAVISEENVMSSLDSVAMATMMILMYKILMRAYMAWRQKNLEQYIDKLIISPQLGLSILYLGCYALTNTKHGIGMQLVNNLLSVETAGVEYVPRKPPNMTYRLLHM